MNSYQGLLLVICVFLSGCASNADDITASYISPVLYEGYSCRQLSEEAQRVSARAAQAAGVQDKKAGNDKVATGVALVLFWPAAFFVSGGDGQNAAELARLRGQMDAIEQTNIKKQCGIQFQRPDQKIAAKKNENPDQCSALYSGDC